MSDFDFEDPELAEAIAKFHAAAAERARRLADQIDRSLFEGARTGSLFNPFRTYKEFLATHLAEVVLCKIRSYPEGSTVVITAAEMEAIDLLLPGARPMRVATILDRKVRVEP